MKIWHRIMFHSTDKVYNDVLALNIKHNILPIPGGNKMMFVEVSEDDPLWPKIKALTKENKSPDMYDTVFTNEEILAAEWNRLIPVFEQGYPQPEKNMEWEKETFKNTCIECGLVFNQKAPFHLNKEPKMGKQSFLSLYWIYTLFCTFQVDEVLKTHGIEGYENYPVMINSVPSNLVSQIICKKTAKNGLDKQDMLNPEYCPKCGIVKYSYHNRGYMHYQEQSLWDDVDIQLTNEWFGSGGNGGYREFIVSKRFTKLIIENNWRGVKLKPIKLI